MSVDDIKALLKFYNVKRGIPTRKAYILNLDGSGTFGPEATVRFCFVLVVWLFSSYLLLQVTYSKYP